MRNQGQFELGSHERPFNIVGLLKTCTTMKDLGKGSKIHAYILEHTVLGKNAYIGSTLINMYAQCGALSKAQQMFEELPVRNMATWSALIAGFVQQGQGEEALKCFDDMLLEGHSPDAVTFICVLKACGSIRAASKGKEIHNIVCALGMLKTDVVLGSTLVDMYVKCGAPSKAQQVLEELPVRNTVTWSVLITGYAQQGQGMEALNCFDNMLHEGHCPDAVTLLSVLKACGSIGTAAKGKEIHDKILSLGLLEKDIMLGNALVDMYAKCGALAKAQQVLKELPTKDVVSWNALIGGYAQQGQGEEALKCYDYMLHEGHFPDAVTFISVLKACGSIRVAAKGKEIHDKAISLGMLQKDIVLGNTLVEMYVKCAVFCKARQVLKELSYRNVATWSALIAGYVQQGQGEEALKCFDDMVNEGHSPDGVTFICVLKACGSVGSAAKGKEIHDKIVVLGMLEKDIVLGNTLVDMYAKCGSLAKAKQVLEELPVRNVVTYNALMAGYGQHGQNLEAINCFERMQANGVKPNSITLISMLNACSHSGLLNQGEAYFTQMATKYGIHPNLEHYCCITDLFSRAGKFNKALSAISEMSSDKCIPNWIALLGACHNWGEEKIAGLAFERALDLEEKCCYSHPDGWYPHSSWHARGRQRRLK